MEFDEYSGAMKLQKERDRVKKEKRKEERREKKEKSKEIAAQTVDKKHTSKKRHRDENSQFYPKDGNHPKRRQEETEQLERSSVTEEQGLPSAIYMCDSPDSSQNSSKRRKPNATDFCNTIQGSVLRIRLPLRQKEAKPPVPPDRPEQASLLLHKQKEIVPVIPVDQPCAPLLAHNKVVPPTPVDQPCFSGRTETRIESTIPVEEKTSAGFSESGFLKGYDGSSKSQRKETKFKDLVINWKPQHLQVELSELDDQEWLFGSSLRRSPRDHVRSCLDDSKHLVPESLLSSWPPRACHIPEADVYVLPFVLPF